MTQVPADVSRSVTCHWNISHKLVKTSWHSLTDEERGLKATQKEWLAKFSMDKRSVRSVQDHKLHDKTVCNKVQT